MHAVQRNACGSAAGRAGATSFVCRATGHSGTDRPASRPISSSPKAGPAAGQHEAEIPSRRKTLVAGTGIALGLSMASLLSPVMLPLAAQAWPEVPVASEEAMQARQGQRIIVTGANSGIGAAMAQELAAQGYNMVLACRNPAKGQAAADAIIAKTGNTTVTARTLDLASLKSVREFASGINSDNAPVAVLANNAGVAWTDYTTTEDGFELQLGVNHMGHFLLTCLLQDALAADGGARVVHTSSDAHYLGDLDTSDLFYQKGRKYDKWGAYAQSKLANVAFSTELARRCTASGLAITSNTFHPGIIDTGLIRYLVPPSVMQDKMDHPGRSKAVAKLIGLRTPEEGAVPGVYLCSSPGVAGVTGAYFGTDCKQKAPKKEGQDPLLAKSLWEASVALTGADGRAFAV